MTVTKGIAMARPLLMCDWPEIVKNLPFSCSDRTIIGFLVQTQDQCYKVDVSQYFNKNGKKIKELQFYFRPLLILKTGL